MSVSIKESKARRPVTADHPVVAAAIEVLEDHEGGPLTSREIFDLALSAGLLDEGQYNTLRARLSQHSGLPDSMAVVVKAPGSESFRGARCTAWCLSGTRVSKKMMTKALQRNFERANERRNETLEKAS